MTSLSIPPPTGAADRDYVESETHLVVAVADYEIPGKGFLPIRENDVLYILEADASGWWLGLNVAGQKGVLPSTYTVPYAFPPPRSETVSELQLIRLAGKYGIDLTSGVPVLPRESMRGVSLLTSGEPPRLRSLDDLYKAMDEAILSRESARVALTAALQQLRRADETAAQASATARPAVDHHHSGALRAARREVLGLQTSLDCVVRALLAEKAAALNVKPAHPANTPGEAHARVSSPGPLAPSHAWYQRAHDLLVANGEAGLADSLSTAAELRDVKRVVQSLEEELTSASRDVKAAEARYRDERAALQSRIEARDVAVTSMLAWWAERADEARSAYLATKAQCLCEAEAGQQELHSVSYALELKRHQFASLIAELEETRQAAKEVKKKLERRGELTDLDEQIQRVNRQLVAAQQEAKRAQRKHHHSHLQRSKAM